MSHPTAKRWRALVAGLTVLAVAATVAIAVQLFDRPTLRVVGHFDRVVGLYVGSDVRVLGVRIGQVIAITPAGDDVRVEMEYRSTYRIAADTHAVLVPPSIVSDRYVQLNPAHGNEPTLPDQAELGLDRTAAPLETDQVYRALSDFTAALGPDGANASGAFSDLLHTGRVALEGNGGNLQQTLDGLSKAAAALADGRDDLFTTLANMATFTTMLAESDEQLRSLNLRLAEVAGTLAGDRVTLEAMLHNLSGALAEVTSFVRDNREALKSDVEGLATVTGIVAQQQQALITIFNTAPLTVSNLILAYNAQTANLDLRINLVLGTVAAAPSTVDGTLGDSTLGGILTGGPR